MILIIDSQGRRYCRDKRWRKFAHFGDWPQCVRVYKYIGAAHKQAACIGGSVVRVPTPPWPDERREVDMSGRVLHTVPVEGRPGYTQTYTHSLSSFIVLPPEGSPCRQNQ